jgi:hypothetical protein
MNTHKIEKYSSKLQDCNDIFKKYMYQQKLSYYMSQKGGIGETNVLIVFNSNQLEGTPLKQIMDENSDKNVLNMDLMSKGDLEKILKSGAYIVEEKKQSAEILGTGLMSKIVNKGDNFPSTIEDSKLVFDSKNIGSEIKNIKSSLEKIKKVSSEIKSSFSKNTENVNTIYNDYNKRKEDFQSKNSPSPVVECADKIIQTTNTLLEMLKNRDGKMGELESIINDSTNAINEKLESLSNSIQDISTFDVKTNAKLYNDGRKDFIGCVSLDKNIKLSNLYSIINANDIAKEIREVVKNKIELDSYMVCTMKTIGKNKLMQIKKIE